MNGTELLTMPEDGYADPEDFLEATPDDEGLPDSLRHWFPDEYVELDIGHRGGGKSARVARKLLLALKHGLTVFTNYELYPEKIGVDNKPHPLDLQFLLSFDTSLNRSVIGIGEVDTWFERKRAMTTTAILVEKFFNQLRKRGLRVIMDTQSPSLPSIILSKVDLLVNCHDFFYTDWGRDHELMKGTTFFYWEVDHSGLFTGYPGRGWGTLMGNANRLWPLYNTYQIFDPWAWARKVEIVGDKMVYDMDDHKMYTSGEHNLAMEQREIIQFNTLLKAQYRAWGDHLIDFAHKAGAVLEEEPNRWRLSLGQIQKAMASLGGKPRKAVEKWLNQVQKLDQSTHGYLAQIDRGQEQIYLSKPIQESPEEVTT